MKNKPPVLFANARYHVPILARALRVLEYLSAHAAGAAAPQVSSSLKIPKNTVYRILTTLVDHGYLIRDADACYRIDRKLLNLGYAAIDESNLVEKSSDILRALRDATGQSVFLGVRIGNEGVVAEQFPGVHPVKVLLQIGHRFPMHTSAPGKILIAYLPDAERECVIDGLTYQKFTLVTISDAAAMRREVRSVRRLGYAVDRGEEVAGLHCVGAPVLNHRGYALAAIWVAGMAAAIPVRDFKMVGIRVRAAAMDISRRFGYTDNGVMAEDV